MVRDTSPAPFQGSRNSPLLRGHSQASQTDDGEVRNPFATPPPSKVALLGGRPPRHTASASSYGENEYIAAEEGAREHTPTAAAADKKKVTFSISPDGRRSTSNPVLSASYSFSPSVDPHAVGPSVPLRYQQLYRYAEEDEQDEAEQLRVQQMQQLYFQQQIQQMMLLQQSLSRSRSPSSSPPTAMPYYYQPMQMPMAMPMYTPMMLPLAPSLSPPRAPPPTPVPRPSPAVPRPSASYSSSSPPPRQEGAYPYTYPYPAAGPSRSSSDPTGFSEWRRSGSSRHPVPSRRYSSTSSRHAAPSASGLSSTEFMRFRGSSKKAINQWYREQDQPLFAFRSWIHDREESRHSSNNTHYSMTSDGETRYYPIEASRPARGSRSRTRMDY